jgi:hypothetical protein
MAPDIPKIDPDRHPDPGAAAWNLSDEVLRQFFHGHSLSDSKDRLIPVFGKVPSESSGAALEFRKTRFRKSNHDRY